MQRSTSCGRCVLVLLLSCGFSTAQDNTASAPVLISKTEPAYTEEAVKDHLSGNVLVSLTVDENGMPTDIKIVKGLGDGLDEKAIEAVSQWRFKPGIKNGVPVPVKAQVSVNFRLLTVTAPSVISKVEPEYTKQARDKQISGNVLLSIVIDPNGVPTDIKVISPLGQGLDEKAIEAVSKWRFKAGTKNGVPAAAKAQVEVSFRLCTTNCGSPDLSRQESARTTFNIAIHELRGDLDAKRDEKAAFRTMERAAAMDYGPAETRLGEFYLTGIGTSADPAKAAEFFDRAAFHGDAEGEYELGRLYRSGTGVPHDPAMALKLFTSAAQRDQPEAELALGIAFEMGEGTSEDLPQAAKWYRKSAEQGNTTAQQRLAKMYWTGSTGKQDQVAALEWALLAEKNGLRDASPDVQRYSAAMSAGRIAEAQKHADHFKPRASKPKN